MIDEIRPDVVIVIHDPEPAAEPVPITRARHDGAVYVRPDGSIGRMSEEELRAMRAKLDAARSGPDAADAWAEITAAALDESD